MILVCDDCLRDRPQPWDAIIERDGKPTCPMCNKHWEPCGICNQLLDPNWEDVFLRRLTGGRDHVHRACILDDVHC
jgi:hypothetical protein